MPQANDDCGQRQEPLIILRVICVAHPQPPEVEQPGKEPFDLPASSIAAPRPALLGGACADWSCWAQSSPCRSSSSTARPAGRCRRLCPQSTARQVGHQACCHRGLDPFYLSRRSAFCPQGERQPRVVGKAHDLGALAPLGFPDQTPPFWAGTNVPSTKHSVRSKPRPL